MADQVNSQITDSVTQANVKVLGEVPAYSMGMVYQTMAHSLSLVMESAGLVQSNMQKVNEAIVSVACKKIMDKL
ncbi:MAG: RebB like protein [Symploca sp. SIO3C6]|uniref:RebB like protein n=1 Tax=Symploca sp. SIO1C4 TaxID=2607765 RepID=A0A6B3NGX3_9CYAN|nr:RebB like protein [Symploca sp. SIO3C6]NER28881.1 RebB like protein [Symploca sp. SIO1C4]NET07030.1 RebB like protein [Symploca sp. SIO2B6]